VINSIKYLIKESGVKKVDYLSSDGLNNCKFSLIDCGLGHSPFGYHNKINRVLRKLTPDLLTKYPVDIYSENLKRLIRKRFRISKKTGIFFNGLGSYGLLSSILNDLIKVDVRKKIKIIGIGPQFTNIALLAQNSGIKYMAFKPELSLSYVEKVNLLIKKIEKEKTPYILYIDNPNNPTGDFIDLNTIVKLSQATQKLGLLIIDEAYGDFVQDNESAITIVNDFSHICVIRSTSKCIGLASLRIGYLVLSQQLVNSYKNFNLAFSVDAISYEIAMVALNVSILGEFLPLIRNKTLRVKEYLVEIFIENNIMVYNSHPEVSILLLKGSRNFYHELLKVGIITEPGSAFKPTFEDIDDSYVRFRIPKNLKIAKEIGRRLKLLK
jgi:histidinol-phosphate aminotransferase